MLAICIQNLKNHLSKSQVEGVGAFGDKKGSDNGIAIDMTVQYIHNLNNGNICRTNHTCHQVKSNVNLITQFQASKEPLANSNKVTNGKMGLN